ncbi:MAG: DNA polymerase III subunit gamma/tau [Treponema sp.]|jgi:DNA polymerase-3 subunit gamma/tau|nr:DNA polymerase III subunit gamma/tau [Treponema sp.]
MPYEVTATRRRPKTFDDLAGQEFVASTLKNSLETKHIAHAYLFSGPRGCGKTSAARIMARALRCEKGPAANPCGVCAQCVEISRGASMDVIEIDGASNTSVDDVRQIKEEVLFPPSSGHYKVYIIDEVHMLSKNAFNALLKTIEEPPPNVVFIFATTELQKVPATIKSRCQQFNFRLLPIDIIKKLLEEACKEMGIKAEEEALFWIAKESTGSIRDAYTLFDQVVSFSEGHIRPEIIREKLGLVGLDKLNEFAESCAVNDFPAALEKIDSILSAGVAVETFVIDLAGYYHSMLLLKAGITRESILGYPPERFSGMVLDKLDEARLAHAGELLFNLHRDLRYSLSPRFELETFASKLCWLDRWISQADLAAAVEQAGSILKGGSPGGMRPLAEALPGSRPVEAQTAAQNKPAPTGKLLEEFERFRAEREKHGKQTPNKNVSEEMPWDNPQSTGPSAGKSVEALQDEVETVIRIFNGTIVNN